MFDYTGQVVAITGAGSGLGKQMARGFAGQGASLFLMDINTERLGEAVAEFQQAGTACMGYALDVTNGEAVELAAQAAIETFGTVDVLVNCAGKAKDVGVLEMTNEDWHSTLECDLSSVFYMTRTFGRIMKEHGYGRVINIASMYGMVGNMLTGTIAYHSAKGGVINFTRAAATELAKYNITVNAICPGYFETEMTKKVYSEMPGQIQQQFEAYVKTHTPIARIGKEGELNAAACFLGSKEASFVTGVILPVDGGYTCV
jgi:NAD(P)-dependent dehydrogenase (short-subunit alcohol dehydrogenase family)